MTIKQQFIKFRILHRITDEVTEKETYSWKMIWIDPRSIVVFYTSLARTVDNTEQTEPVIRLEMAHGEPSSVYITEEEFIKKMDSKLAEIKAIEDAEALEFERELTDEPLFGAEDANRLAADLATIYQEFESFKKTALLVAGIISAVVIAAIIVLFSIYG